MTAPNPAKRPLKHREKQEVSAILRQYARVLNGKIIHCTPSKAEQENRYLRRASENTDGKVIYDNRALALQAADALSEVTGIRYDYYRCPRSRNGHCHLRTVRPRST